jgi:hypothetical protein
MKYGIIKAPPPFRAAWTGNRKKFPSPTAEPATARTTPNLDPQLSLSPAISLSFPNNPVYYLKTYRRLSQVENVITLSLFLSLD